jgi:fido (protein-threonine AMPylation protein)
MKYFQTLGAISVRANLTEAAAALVRMKASRVADGKGKRSGFFDSQRLQSI